MSEADAIRDVLYAERARVVSLEAKIADLETANKVLDAENDILSSEIETLKDKIAELEKFKREATELLKSGAELMLPAKARIVELEAEVKQARDLLIHAEERGAREMAYLFFKDTHACPSAFVNEYMHKWKESRAK